MQKIDEAFHSVKCFNGDAYVADYTNQTQNEAGVCLSETAPEDIHYFHLVNRHNVEYWGVNFEENAGFFEKGINQCECMFASKNAKKKGWGCLVELKYCLKKNVAGNSESAFVQLKNTLAYLTRKEVVSTARHRVYLNISIPDHSHKEPFLSFISTQDETLNALKANRVQILGYNEVLILNESYLRVPREAIL